MDDRISEALERMERRAEIALRHTKEDMDTEKAERWKRALEHYTCAAEALKEIQKYRVIGTVEECQAAVEKQNAKPVCMQERGIREKSMIKEYYCPQCGAPLNIADESNNFKTLKCIFCFTCGQKLEW